MENKVIAKEYVDENYIHKDKIRGKIKQLEEEYKQFADWDRDDDCMITREEIEILEGLLEDK